ncbi:MAG: hypothetical protein LBJ00_12480, partial [Planctomycetaceae bacterium]|nr:hypothetical protein [Planctomycetaceae bacterium]
MITYRGLSVLVVILIITFSYRVGADDEFWVKLEIYPQKIHFGDVFFSKLVIQNNTKSSKFIRHPTIQCTLPVANIFIDGKTYYVWYDNWAYGHVEGILPYRRTFPSFNFIPITTGSQKNFDFRMFWLPLPSQPGDLLATELEQILKNESRKIVFTRTNADQMLAVTSAVKGLSATDELSILFDQIHVDIVVKHRKNTILTTLREWYNEVPSNMWNVIQGRGCSARIFAGYEYATGSPLEKIVNKYDYYSQPNLKRYSKLHKDRQPFKKEYESFAFLLRTRTPELLARIKRTKELEAELLKLPDSELSQNMKEFIQLRGHLVDIRFAENAAEENKAFDNFVTFIDKSKDKELWIRFVIEIGFNSIVDHEYFPYKKAEDYCK